MSNQQTELDNVAKAFSAQAPLFDEYEQRNAILQWMRKQIYSACDKYLKPGDSILDINAGTGIDAVHFAQQGHSVFAADIAEGMIAGIQKKIEALNLSQHIQTQRLSYTNLKLLQPNKFHFVLSNFGGLNCVSNLQPIAEQLKQLLHPNGIVTLVIMPKFCLWEMLHFFKGNFSLAFRRLRKNGSIAHVEGHYFLTYYHSVSTVIKSFGKKFKVLEIRGLASLVPPPYMETFPQKYPRIYKLLTIVDELIAPFPPFNRCADHYILTLQYIPEKQ